MDLVDYLCVLQGWHRLSGSISTDNSGGIRILFRLEPCLSHNLFSTPAASEYSHVTLPHKINLGAGKDCYPKGHSYIQRISGGHWRT
jgi:hypothetical protein